MAPSYISQTDFLNEPVLRQYAPVIPGRMKIKERKNSSQQKKLL